MILKIFFGFRSKADVADELWAAGWVGGWVSKWKFCVIINPSFEESHLIIFDDVETSKWIIIKTELTQKSKLVSQLCEVQKTWV